MTALPSQHAWTLTCPEHWTLEQEEDSAVCYDSEAGVGTLVITAFCREDADFDDRALADLAAEAPREAQRLPCQLGELHGLMLSYHADGSAWREWYLAQGSCAFFVSYDCPEEYEGEEDEEVATILASLHFTG